MAFDNKKPGYTITKDGMLQGDGLPDGVKIDMSAYQAALDRRSGGRVDPALSAMYPTNKSAPLLSDYVTKFKYSPEGVLMAFIPDAPQKMYSGNPQSNGPNMPKSNLDSNFFSPDAGEWVKASGINLDKSSVSGTDRGYFTFRMDQGAPLAVFGSDDGYARIAMQGPKSADNIRLGNNSGTTSNVRQNAQRRTLL